MAFPTTSILDNFNRANENPLANGNWSADPDGTGDAALKIVSSQCVGAGSGFNGRYWSASTFGPDTEVYVTVVTKPGDGNRVSMWARLATPATSGADGYYFKLLQVAGAGNDSFEINRIDNTVYTQLGSPVSNEFANGDVVGMSVIGSAIAVYKNGTSINSTTDSTYSAAGYIGLECVQTTAVMDDFGGGSIASASTLGRKMLLGVGI